jgi:choline transport protein
MFSGWITLGAWCFACSGPPSIIANMITAMASYNNPGYVPERWHTSLIMIAVMITPFTFNLWFRQLLNGFEMFGGILYFVLLVIFLIILIVFGPRNSNEFVFHTLIWEVSGWNNKGVSWGLGLLSMSFSVCGADSILHMCKSQK